jgi:tRNA threonylcarbamoyladenosine biosynthesis protein TsaE
MLKRGEPFISRSPEETVELGRELGRSLIPPVLVLLSGDLGAGKTTLTKGIIGALGAAEENDVTSPTFTLVHVFQKRHAPRVNTGANIELNHDVNNDLNNDPSAGEVSVTSPASSAPGPENHPVKVYHVDLYRVEGSNDLATLALEDALSEPAVVIIEWSERFSLRSEWPRINVTLEHCEGDSRRFTISEPVLPGATAIASSAAIGPSTKCH